MKKFYYSCKIISSGEIKEIFVIANDIFKAEEKMLQKKEEFIPIQYLGWTWLDEKEEEK